MWFLDPPHLLQRVIRILLCRNGEVGIIKSNDMKYKIFDDIVIQVSEFTTADHSEIFSSNKERATVDGRFFIIYIAEQLEVSRPYIKRFFKLHGFDITYRMINYSLKATKKRLKKDKYLKERLNEIINTYKIEEHE